MVVVMLPVLLAVGLSSTLVYLTGITVSPLTTVSGPLVIAICTEFATLILFRHLEERRQGYSPEESIDVAAAHTGRAFFASALTTVGGFAVMLFSPLPLLRDFGAIVAITVAIALISAVTVLPPVLIWADNHGWVAPGRGRRPNDPPETDRRRRCAAAPVPELTTGLTDRVWLTPPVTWNLVAEDSSPQIAGPNAWLVDEMYEQYLADPVIGQRELARLLPGLPPHGGASRRARPPRRPPRRRPPCPP